jgi:hypothetical protein
MKIGPKFVRTTVALIATGMSLMAVAADKDDFERRADRLRAGPAEAPLSNETGFSKGLKCMDGLFRTYGVSNVTVVLDQIPDATKKINVGARDMFLSATAEMTRTSHAIRLVPIVDTRVFTETKRDRVVADADFAIQGSISQYDDSMLQKQRDGAVCIWKLCIGAADSDKISGLGLDLNLVETAGMSLVPGASVKNAVLLRRHGDGYDGDLTVKNFSIQANYTLVSSDANGQALRTLIELGAIELYGRMLKLPYWSCMGATEQDPVVSSEIDDWWEEMAADPRSMTRLMGYLQLQMKVQGLYGGPIDGRGNEALLRTVRAYELAMGMPDELNLDGHFLHKYLAADHAQVRKVAVTRLAEINQKEGPLPPEPVAQAAPPPGAAAQVAQAGPANQGAPAPTAAVGQGATNAQSARPTQNVATGPSVSGTQSGQAAARGAMSAPVAAAATPTAAPVAATQPVAPAPVAAAPQSTTTAQSAAPSAVAAAQPAPRPAAPSTVATQSVAPAPVAAPSPVAPRSVTAASTPQAASAPALVPAVYHPTPIRIDGSRPANNSTYRAGEPFYVGVISPRDGYLYCYLVDEHQRIAQFYPAPSQSLDRLSSGTLKVLNAESPLIASHPGHRQEVACFSSAKDLGRQPVETGSVLGLDALKTRFAIAVSGAYAMGVFDVKVQ